MKRMGNFHLWFSRGRNNFPLRTKSFPASALFSFSKTKTKRKTADAKDFVAERKIILSSEGPGELEGKLVMLDVAEPKVEKDRHAIPK